ncbi:amidase family protein [Lentzea rhizosphaerae]|uniref:Amidase family protein n=1 Tax=Lentzea rhizosphaerae TaxID=2041025 RepID=A0ABV8BLK8_9PSEU
MATANPSVPIRNGCGSACSPLCPPACPSTRNALRPLRKPAGCWSHSGTTSTPVEPEFFSEEARIAYAQTVVDASLCAMPFNRPELVGSQLRQRMERARNRDVLLTPTIACLPPLVDTVLREAVGNPDGLRLTETQMISFTSFCNITGLPAISLPAHTSADGLPVGAQLVAGPWDEAVLIRLASALEPLVGWTQGRAALTWPGSAARRGGGRGSAAPRARPAPAALQVRGGGRT